MNTFSHEHAHANSRSLTFGHKQSALKPALAKVVTLAIAGGLALVAVAGCASTSSTRGLSPPGDGDRVAVLITGTAHEPHPMLTAGALQGGAYCGGEHERHRDGPGGKSSSELVNYRRRPTLSGRGAHPRVEPTARSSTAAAFEADRRQLAAGCRHPW